MKPLRRVPLWIGGRARDTQNADVIKSPWDGAPLAEVARAGAAEVDDAIAIAAAAFPRVRALPTHARVAILEGCAARLRERGEELALGMARESGKPLRFARAEVARAVVTFQLAAAEARRFGGEVLPIDLEPRAEGRLCLYQRVPLGPVAAIAPFNFPLNLVAHKLAPAIAVGAPVVLKPPPQAPLSSFALAEMLYAAGLPPEALSVVHCAPEVAQRLVEDERMRVLSFTGSDAVGWRLKALAKKKHVLLELGGSAPCIVDEEADLDDALPKIISGAWAQAGQVCIKVQRVLVAAQRFAPFLERFVAATRALRCGDPLDPDTVVGPLISAEHVARVLEWVAEARARGAHVHCGAQAEGPVVLPTVLTNVPDDCRVVREEVFGPVTVVESFANFDTALARCNAGRFGLQAGVFTPRLDRALRAFRELDYGGIIINDVPTFRVDNFPYGGTKDSGFGREGVRFAMEEMSEPKALVIAPVGP